MKLSKLSNQTNSQDPQAVNSRVFVGNLNTFQCSKTDVERMFQIYGRLAGISMHKGYAFVQFTNPFDARNACHGEDGRTVLSQTLDVNMVAEPKAHQIGRKRQNVTKTGNDWDYFYDSYCSSSLFRTSRPKKRKRLMTPTSRMLNEAVSSNNINAAVAAAAAVQQQQKHLQQQHQQHQQQHHMHHHSVPQHQQQQQHQHQQQAAAAAMAAMANLLPQQQILMHQQNLLTNTNGNGVQCNGATTTTSHHGLNLFLQQQQQQQQIKQQQHHHHHHQQQAGPYSVAAAAAAAGLQLKGSAVQNATSAIISAANQTMPSSSDPMSTTVVTTTTAYGCANNQTHLQQNQQQQQQQHLNNMQQLSLTLPTQNSLMQQQPPQQQQQQHYQQQQNEQLTSNQQWGPFKVYSNPDTLICGNCREYFNELAELLDHKKSYCKLRFTCKCQDVALPGSTAAVTAANARTSLSSAKLLCAVCKDSFNNPWDLMVHAQAAHMVNIYELGNEANSNNANCGDTNTDGAATVTKISKDMQATATLIKGQHNNNENNNISSNNNNTLKINNNITNGNNSSDIINNNSSNSNNNCDIQTLSNDVEMSPIASDPKLPQISKLDVSVVGVIGGGVGVSADGASSSCNNSIAGDGSVSESEPHCMEIKFDICNSPNDSIAKEDAQRDDASLDEHTSNSSQIHNSDEIKILIGSVSSRGSSPVLDTDEQHQRACIVRTLSIEATTSNATNTASALGIISKSLALGLANGAAKAAAAIIPQ
ncbi:transcription factor mef2A [Teleopsis dalmanni]|uniref:transcription factor mef2A n=1 Tax=Teleopsis dalmanni TaxID=139649 RepID=UPI0018CD2922|nr:transcription factor mef2A [Teleopsis dalmanni]